MHKAVISNEVEPGLVIDHLNRNRLDNRRQNLRITGPSDNSQNKSVSKNNTTGFMGVERKKGNSKWSARIHKDHVEYQLGTFDHPIIAAVAYNIKALELYDQPFLNSIDDEYIISVERAKEIVRENQSADNISKLAEAMDGMSVSEGSTSNKRRDTASRFKGVTKSCGKNRWNAEIGKDGQRFKLGTYSCRRGSCSRVQCKGYRTICESSIEHSY